MGAIQRDLAEIEARTRELTIERGIGWQDAWHIAEAEATGEQPRKRDGCLVGGLRVAFWVVIGSAIYVSLTMLILYASSPFISNLADGRGVLIAGAGMVSGTVAAVLLARRFPSIPVKLMATVVLLVAGGFVAFIAFSVAAGPSQDSIDAAERHDYLVSTLDLTVSSVTIPQEWEVQLQGASPYSPSVGYMASPDLSTSGTWMLISVAPNEGDFSEDSYWLSLEAGFDESGGRLVHEPDPTSLSGVEGYLFEVAGLKGSKTGQELGAYVAVFFGPDHTYQLMVQFELPDRDDMSLVYLNTVIRLTLGEHGDEV